MTHSALLNQIRLGEDCTRQFKAGVRNAESLAAEMVVRPEQPGLKTASLVSQSRKPRRTAERWLKQLKAQGLVEFRGAPKTGGYHATYQRPPKLIQCEST